MQRWMRTVLIVLLVLLTLCAAVMFLTDPYQKYRIATGFTPDYYNGEEGYTNAGIARHFDYDAVILGTSMVENMKPSLVDAAFGTHSVKLPFEGGMAANHAQALRLALATHEVREVFYGMDMYSFVRDPGYSAFVLPSYLYDDNPFSDIEYLLNGDILFHRMPSLLLRNLQRTDPPPTRDEMYAWKSDVRYAREVALASYDFSAPAQKMLEADAFEKNVRVNFERFVERYLERYPDTRFTFFFPPYSSLQYYIMQQNGHFDAVLRTKEQLTELLLPYGNARLFDFTANLAWIENLDLYTDYSHFSPQVSDAIVEALADGAFRLQSVEQVRENNDVLRDVVARFPVPTP